MAAWDGVSMGSQNGIDFLSNLQRSGGIGALHVEGCGGRGGWGGFGGAGGALGGAGGGGGGLSCGMCRKVLTYGSHSEFAFARMHTMCRWWLRCIDRVRELGCVVVVVEADKVIASDALIAPLTIIAVVESCCGETRVE